MEKPTENVGEPKDNMTYDAMLSKIREELKCFKINRKSRELGVKYRILLSMSNDIKYRPNVDIVNDVYKRLFVNQTGSEKGANK